MAGQGLIGLTGILVLAWGLSKDRAAVSFRLIAGGVMLEFALALILLRSHALRSVFMLLGRGVDALADASRAGTSFVFGYAGGGPPPFTVTAPEHGFILALQALPMVLVITALSALFYHWGVLPRIVRALSVPLERLFGLGGAVGMSAAAMPFLGMVESPLLVRPYLSSLSQGELFIIMTGGMSTIAGTVMVLYATFLKGVIDDPAGHLLSAAVMSIPAALIIAKTLHPDAARTGGGALPPSRHGGALDALMGGTMDGLRILASITAVLIVAIALVHLLNDALALIPGIGLSLERLMGWVMAPVAWSIGVPWDEAATAGALLGEKLVLNELVAYADLANRSPEALGGQSRLILTFALCGFANFGSLGILISGLTAMAPERRAHILSLGPRALLAGTMVTCLTGAVAGLVGT